MKILVICGMKTRSFMLDDGYVNAIVERDEKVALVVNDAEVKGVIGILEPFLNKVRLLISPFNDEYFDNLDNYVIEMKRSDDTESEEDEDKKEILFFLTSKTDS